MRSEALKTGLWAAAALGLTLAAVSVEPEARKAEIFSDQGEVLFPLLRDANAAQAIEVIDYNESEAVARPLKVELRKGRWVLSSHNDYPAEARERMARTAGALVDLKKDAVVSDRFEDHGKYGVIDPLDEKVTALTGRGKRVTLRDGAGKVLADVVLGLEEKTRPGYRYVRVPGQKRVYSVKTEAEPSARFEDWVEGNLLRLQVGQLKRIVLLSYQIDERSGRLANAQRVVLTRNGDAWKQEGGAPLAPGKAAVIASTLCSLRIAGARPKPKDLAEQLRGGQGMELTLDAILALRQRGFFVTPAGQLMANEGEIVVETESGMTVNLRIGEIATASDAAKVEVKDPAKAAQENRYVFVSSTDAALRAKFADWFYVISGADFARLRLGAAPSVSETPELPRRPPGGDR